MKNQEIDNIADKAGNENEDDLCDIYSNKVCDSCGKCLGLEESDYRIVRIDGIVNLDNDNNEAADGELDIDLEEYILEDVTLDKVEEYEGEDMLAIEYIEDIPELKEEYDHKIDKLLGRE